jgi:hypothetical protein
VDAGNDTTATDRDAAWHPHVVDPVCWRCCTD